MRALVLHAHPVPESFSAALRAQVVATLEARGWSVDLLDLYADGFQPVLTAEERRSYHAPGLPEDVAGYVARLRAAEALVLVFPVWNFGPPAILKGFFDRVFLPGVSFELRDGRVRGALHNIRRLAAVTTYGGARSRALLVGDPPRRIVTRVLRAVVHPLARARYVAMYDMNRATDAQRAAFLARTTRAMGEL